MQNGARIANHHGLPPRAPNDIKTKQSNAKSNGAHTMIKVIWLIGSSSDHETASNLPKIKNGNLTTLISTIYQPLILLYLDIAIECSSHTR